MIFVYILSCASLGWIVLTLMCKIKIIKLEVFTVYEKIASSLMVGFLVFTTYIFILNYLHIPFGFHLSIPLYGSLIYMCVCMYRYKIINKLPSKIKTFFSINFFRENFLSILLISIFVILLINCMFRAIVAHPYLPDEFSHWAIQPKLFYEGKSMATFLPTYLEHYPPFLSLLASGFYFFTGALADNMIRIFPTIFLLITVLSMVGIAKRRKLNVNIIFLLFNLIILFYPVFQDILSSMYADIPFMCAYSIGVIYLLDYFLQGRKNKSFLWLSLLFTTVSVWSKIDGIYLFCYTFFVIVVGNLIFNKIEKKPLKYNFIATSIYAMLPLLYSLSWRVFRILNHFPKSEAQDVSAISGINFPVLKPMLKAMYAQIYDSSIIVIMGLAFLVMVFMTINYMKKRDSIYLLTMFSFVIINVLFLMICYLTIFGGEGATAASFIRYMTRVIPVVIMMILETLLIFKTEKNMVD